MNDTRPAPLTMPGMDVRDLDGFMLNAERLMASELVALSTGEEFKAAVLLWCRAWKQVPAGSLPNDDRVLASFAGAGSRWKKIKAMALRGFVECSDGRLYHRVLCEDVKRAFIKKEERRERTRAATEARKKERNEQRNEQRNVGRNVQRDDHHNPNVTTSQGQDRTGTGQKKEEVAAPSTAPPPARELAPAEALCAELGLSLQANFVRVNWPGMIARWMENGGMLEDLLAAARRSKARGDGEKSLGWYQKMAEDERKKREAATASEAESARNRRIDWLKVYHIPKVDDSPHSIGVSGPGGWRWAANKSGNGVWDDGLGIGAPPHDPRTLVTDAELDLVPAARAMRDANVSREKGA